MFLLATVFAYGQTSSGKTYTMTGITEYTIADIYDYIQKVMKTHQTYLAHFSGHFSSATFFVVVSFNSLLAINFSTRRGNLL